MSCWPYDAAPTSADAVYNASPYIQPAIENVTSFPHPVNPGLCSTQIFDSDSTLTYFWGPRLNSDSTQHGRERIGRCDRRCVGIAGHIPTYTLGWPLLSLDVAKALPQGGIGCILSHWFPPINVKQIFEKIKRRHRRFKIWKIWKIWKIFQIDFHFFIFLGYLNYLELHIYQIHRQNNDS